MHSWSAIDDRFSRLRPAARRTTAVRSATAARPRIRSAAAATKLRSIRSDARWNRRSCFRPQRHSRPAPKGSAGAGTPSACRLAGHADVETQKIAAFYPPGSLEKLSQDIARSGALAKVSAEWKIPMVRRSGRILILLTDLVACSAGSRDGLLSTRSLRCCHLR